MGLMKVQAPIVASEIEALRSGDMVSLSGIIYTARDAAHKRLIEMIHNKEELPIPLKDTCIYYVGPCPAPPGKPIGSCGPTTSGRMDAYSPELFDLGVKAVIGKGLRSQEVVDSIRRNKAVYFAATGGAAALISQRVKSCELVAFEDLGAEAIYRLEVVDFPLIVAIDSTGNDLYQTGPEQFRKE